MENIGMRPAFSVTVEEMANYMLKKMADCSFYSQKEEPQKTRTKIWGIKGLSEYIGCSIVTAQKFKKSGVVRFYNMGSKVYFFADEVDQALITWGK